MPKKILKVRRLKDVRAQQRRQMKKDDAFLSLDRKLTGLASRMHSHRARQLKAAMDAAEGKKKKNTRKRKK